ncbi:hypothetical protein LTR08_001575 [Meristemomyces frigidus]|nr:hypothetical protein LTR08_001575 [Meristemomyces frigidus]
MEPITHIVLFKYSPSLPWQTLQSHFTSFRALRTRCLRPAVSGKPYMLSMRMGQNRSWEPFSKGLTHAFILEFATQADLDYYLTADPVHIAFSSDVTARGLVEDSVVMDIQDGTVLLSPADMPTRPGAKQGSCHCGAVRFTAVLAPAGDQSNHVLCHCRTCQLMSGGPYSCNQIIPEADLTITEGTPSTYTYTGASGKAVNCYFCGTCTSHVYHKQVAMPGKVIVRTLLLEGAEEWGVGGEIFAEGRLGWVRDLSGALDGEQCEAERRVNGVSG